MGATGAGRGGVPEKVTFKQRLEEGREEARGTRGKRWLPVQRPWGPSVHRHSCAPGRRLGWP